MRGSFQQFWHLINNLKQITFCTYENDTKYNEVRQYRSCNLSMRHIDNNIIQFLQI